MPASPIQGRRHKSPDPVLPDCSYCKHQLYSVAADVMAKDPDGVARFLSPNVYDFLQATTLREVGLQCLVHVAGLHRACLALAGPGCRAR
jgi:hypothetical protein